MHGDKRLESIHCDALWEVHLAQAKLEREFPDPSLTQFLILFASASEEGKVYFSLSLGKREFENKILGDKDPEHLPLLVDALLSCRNVNRAAELIKERYTDAPPPVVRAFVKVN